MCSGPDGAAAANSSSRGGLLGGSPASTSPVEDCWMQGISHHDGLEVRHSTAMELLEVLASPKSSQGSVLGNVLPAAPLVGLVAPSATAVTLGRFTERPLLREQSGPTTHTMQDYAFATGTVAGLTLNELPSNGMRSLEPPTGTPYTVAGSDRMAYVRGATGFRAAASPIAGAGKCELDPQFPSLTQLAADLQALRHDFVVMPHVGEAVELSPATAMPPVASEPGPPVVTGLIDRANQHTGQEALMRAVSNHGGPSFSPNHASPARSRPAEISAQMQNSGGSHNCGGGDDELASTLSAGQLGNPQAGGLDIHVAEIPFNRDAQQGDVAWAQRGGETSIATAPRVTQAGSSGGDVSVWCAPPLSQLARELRQEREGMGEGATKPSGVGIEAAGDGTRQLLEPDQSTAVRMQGAGLGPAEQVGEPLLEACGADIHANPENARPEDHFETDMPGPMTQLIMGMREARKGLQMGYGGGGGSVGASICELAKGTGDGFTTLPPPSRSPPLHDPMAEPGVMAGSAAARHGMKCDPAAPTLSELWGLADCEDPAREAPVVPGPREGFASPMPGEMTGCQDATPAAVDHFRGPHSMWDDDAISQPIHEATARAAVAGAASTAAAGTAAGSAIFSRAPAQADWTSRDNYVNTTAETSLTQLIKGLREARQQLRSPELGNPPALAPTRGGGGDGGFPDSVQSCHKAGAPGRQAPSVLHVPSKAPCQAPALGALACTVLDPPDPRLGEEPYGDSPGERSGDGEDKDISFSQLVRLLQQQKLSRTREACVLREPSIETRFAARKDVGSGKPGPPVGNAQTGPASDVGGISGFRDPALDHSADPSLLAHGTFHDNGNLHVDDINHHGDLRNGETGSMEWEHEPEVTVHHMIGPGASPQHREIFGAANSPKYMAAIPITASAQVGLDCGMRTAAAASVAEASNIPCRQQLPQPGSPYLLGPTADVSRPPAQAAHVGVAAIAVERPTRAAAAAAIASAVAAAAAMPLPSQHEGSGRGSGSALTEPAASGLGPGQAQMDGELPGSCTPSPSPSPDLRPAALVDRFGPSPLMQRGGVTPTRTALTTADTGDAGTHVGGGDGVAHPAGYTSTAAALTPGSRSLPPTCLQERHEQPVDADDDDVVECRTPVTVTPEFSFLVSRPNIPEYSGGDSGSGGGGGGGNKGCGYEDGSNPGGPGGSKPAARKMDSRTPTLLSSQGRRKQRQPRRFTPISMKAPLPAAPSTTPTPASQKAVTNTSVVATYVGTMQGVPYSPRGSSGSQLRSASCQPLQPPHFKTEPEEAGLAPGLVTAFSFQRHQEQHSAGTQTPATKTSITVDPSVLNRSKQEGRRHGQHTPGTGLRDDLISSQVQDFQGCHGLCRSSQTSAPSQSQGQGLMALLRASVLGSAQHYHGYSQNKVEGALLLSSQVPGFAPFTLPVLKPEEIRVRRSQMPWGAARSPQGSSACGSWGPSRCQMSAGANDAAAAVAGVGEDAMPITPGPGLDGEESDDGMLDVEALVAAGRAAVGLETPLPAGAAAATRAVHPALDDSEGALHVYGGDGAAGIEATARNAVMVETLLDCLGIQAAGNPGLCAEPGRRQLATAATEHGADASPKAANNLPQHQQQRSADPMAAAFVQHITVQDVAGAATTGQALPSDSQSQQQSEGTWKQVATAVCSGRQCDVSEVAPSLAEATAALGCLGLADDALNPVRLGDANAEDFRRDRNGGRLQARDSSHQNWRQGHGANSTGRVHGEEGRQDCSASIGRDLLDGAVVIIDRCLPRQQAETCATAVEALGGRISSATHLKCGAKAVVCEHSRASHWLAWGVHLLSPRSLRRLAGEHAGEEPQLKESSQAAPGDPSAGDLVYLSRGIMHALQRLVGDVAHPWAAEDHSGQPTDASRAGDSGFEAQHSAGTRNAARHESAVLTAIESDGDGVGEQPAEDPWPTLEARKRFLLNLKAFEAAAGTRLQGLGLAGDQPGGLQSVAPLTLLENLVWRLTEPPQCAQITTGTPATEESFAVSNGGAEPDAPGDNNCISMLSEGQGLMGGLHENSGDCGLGSVIKPPSFHPGNAGGDPRPVEAEDLNTVVFVGPRLTLLLPQDEHGLLGHQAVTLVQSVGPWQLAVGAQAVDRIQNPGAISGADVANTPCNGGDRSCSCSCGGAGNGHGITMRELLMAIHQHYAQHMSPTEVAAAMSSHPMLRRQLQVAWQRRTSVPRSALLGRKTVLCGLRRCSLAGSLAVYELNLIG
ncbi:hypothetical protein Vafri_2880 [Volvox africanus]|nr:hypothetical protein Vafri_2880 [Volvox africanus]